jgi:D-arabinose 1-dehydrogenase-like Zn-dependent alcohol dehydrogenase
MTDLTWFYLKCGSGHESAGEVIEVGEGVTQWKAGENLALRSPQVKILR